MSRQSRAPLDNMARRSIVAQHHPGRSAVARAVAAQSGFGPCRGNRNCRDQIAVFAMAVRTNMVNDRPALRHRQAMCRDRRQASLQDMGRDEFSQPELQKMASAPPIKSDPSFQNRGNDDQRNS